MKAIFPTQADADEARASDQESYPCQARRGWHLRTVRDD